MSTEERLKHAIGALSEIYYLATSCVAEDAPAETHELAEAIVRRILCSAHEVHSRPAWFVHGWEERLWIEFEAGRIHACGTDQPTNRVISEIDRALSDGL